METQEKNRFTVKKIDGKTECRQSLPSLEEEVEDLLAYLFQRLAHPAFAVAYVPSYVDPSLGPRDLGRGVQ